jgi:hypothetical protein
MLENSAYTPNKSTHHALSKLFNIHFKKDECLIGVDFQNAFSMCCRKCLNLITQTNLLPNKIFYNVLVNGKASDLACSTTGSGAGRPSGGGCFNIILKSFFDKYDINFNKLAAYADDSQYLIKLSDTEIGNILEIFKSSYEFGLLPHLKGIKGPTILVNDYNRDFKSSFDVSITTSVKFLGPVLSLSSNGYLVASLPPKKFRSLFCLSFAFGSGLKLARFSSTDFEYCRIFKTASLSVSCLIESKILYSIMYLGKFSISKLYYIHRLAICKLADFKPNFFGFGSQRSYAKLNDKDPIWNLFDFIYKLESETYRIVCAALGRPTILELALKSANVILKQADFNNWCRSESATRFKPSKFHQKVVDFINKSNEYLINHSNKCLNIAYLGLKNRKERRIFIKLITDRFLHDDLSGKGFEIDNNLCRVCKMGNENFDHMLNNHCKVTNSKLKRLTLAVENAAGKDKVKMVEAARLCLGDMKSILRMKRCKRDHGRFTLGSIVPNVALNMIDNLKHLNLQTPPRKRVKLKP